MPVFAMFAGVFALSSLAFPGTNSFIGEFLVMSGGFCSDAERQAAVSKMLMICVVPGVVLAAAYMLRMLQKSPMAAPAIRTTHCLRTWVSGSLTLAPLLVFVFWIGLHPAPFTRVCTPACNTCSNKSPTGRRLCNR